MRKRFYYRHQLKNINKNKESKPVQIHQLREKKKNYLIMTKEMVPYKQRTGRSVCADL